MGAEPVLRSTAAILLLCAGLGCASLTGCSPRQTQTAPQQAETQPTAAAGQEAELVKQGKLLFDQTPKYAFHYVGNQLACGDCHVNSGTADYAAPMTDLAGLFPMFSKRAGHEISLRDRIDECFVRSESGRPLPPDSEEMRALVAYIQSLSRGTEKGKPYAGRGLVKLPDLKGDPVRGRVVYVQQQCSICHGSDGAGIPPVMPPLWGSGSFNDGAGMNKPDKMAAYVFHNMPQNHPGALTAQEAYDVAAYIHMKPRPKFNPTYKNF